MTISTVLFAEVIPFTRARTPSPGCTKSLTGDPPYSRFRGHLPTLACLLLLYLAVVTPFGKIRRPIVRVSVKNHTMSRGPKNPANMKGAGLVAAALAVSFSVVMAAD